jgi:hypothetical protein
MFKNRTIIYRKRKRSVRDISVPFSSLGTAPQSAGRSSNSHCAADQINLAADRCFIMNVGHTNSKRIVKSLDILGHNTSFFYNWHNTRLGQKTF